MTRRWMCPHLSTLAAVTLLAACALEGTENVEPEPDAGYDAPIQAALLDELFGEGEALASSFPPVERFDVEGSFWTTRHAGGWSCTVWRPRVLGEAGRKHPVVVWGNGTVNTPGNYAVLFDHWASHGFIVVAANTSAAGSGREMLACLDYVFAENGALGAFAGHADTDNIGVAGYSQGGCGALTAGTDRRVKSSALVSPFIVVPLGFCNSLSIAAQHAPMFLLSGTLDPVAQPILNQLPIYNGAQVPIVWGSYGVGHLEVLGDGGVYQGPLTAWLRATLMNDSNAQRIFSRTTCELCSTWGWEVQHNLHWTLAAPF